MDKKMQLANDRRHGTTKLRPVDVFLEKEGGELNILPSSSFIREEYAYAKVRKDGHVRFQNKYYSVDKKNINKSVFIIGNNEIVKIYLDGSLLETHAPLKCPHLSKATKKHHLEPYEQVISSGEQYLEKGRKIGPYVEKIIELILLTGNGFVDTRKVWGILSLDKTYSADKINEACRNCLDSRQLNYRAVLSFLKVRPEEKAEIPTNPHNKFVRDMSEYSTHLGKLLH